jgi:S-sulfo-L-cysteine synthase (3-phospho-L-serine-dependent)
MIEQLDVRRGGSFGGPEEAVVLLGFSSIVDFAKRQGFRTAVVSCGFSLEDVFRIDHPIRIDPKDEAAVRKSLMELNAAVRIRGVSAFDDNSVLVAAKAGEWLKLKHTPPAGAVHHCIRKDEMRRMLARKPELTIPYQVVEREGEASKAVDKIGLPCVVKPVDSSNSRLVAFCANTAAAVAAVKAVFEWAREQGKTQRVLIERYVEGQEFSVECFTQNGNTTVMAVCEKILGPLPYFVEIGHYCPTQQSRDIEHSLMETARRALELLGVDNLVTHTELRRTPHGNKIIEINPRPAGGKLQEFIRTITGYDLHEAALQVALGRKPIAAPARASHGYYHCLTTDVEGVVSYNTGYLRSPLANGLYPLVELTVHTHERVYPVNHKDGKILGRILAYGNGFEMVHHEIWKVLGELQFKITVAQPSVAAHRGQAGISAAQSLYVPATPAWIPGFGWIWLPLTDSNAAPAPYPPAVHVGQPPSAPNGRTPPAPPIEPENGRRAGAQTANRSARTGAQTKKAESALAAFRTLTRPDNFTAANSEKSSCCTGARDKVGPEQQTQETVRAGSGAWERGCC